MASESETNTAAEEGKTFDISCPHCGEILLGNELIVGLTVECPYCSKTFTAPAAPAESPAPFPSGAAASPASVRKGCLPPPGSAPAPAASFFGAAVCSQTKPSPPFGSSGHTARSFYNRSPYIILHFAPVCKIFLFRLSSFVSLEHPAGISKFLSNRY